jgi:glycosyltransferase involved in cell wall biosynthesis
VSIRLNLTVAVCGKFHYHNYVRYLDQAGLLNRFYYSHNIYTSAARLGIAPERAVNCWPKEYLIRLHAMLTRGWLVPQLAPVYSAIWQGAVLRRWERCELFHVMLHGTAHKLVRRAKSEGAIVLGEPVNQHPRALHGILREEAEHWGLKPPNSLNATQKNQLEETALADFLLTPSQIVRDSFVKRGFAPARTAVIPYGVDLNSFRPTCDRQRSDRIFRVICVAQVSLRKGQLYLLEAWRKLRLRDAELLLIGAISYEISTLIRQYEGMFRHIPFVANDKLRGEYGRSSVFVLPSVEDGFGYVIGEAMACGLPVVTTENTGGADIICQGIDGFVVPIRSPEAIAEALETLYRNKEMREEMSAAAFAKARSDLSWEVYFDRLCRFYRSLLLQGKADTPSASRITSDAQPQSPGMRDLVHGQYEISRGLDPVQVA